MSQNRGLAQTLRPICNKTKVLSSTQVAFFLKISDKHDQTAFPSEIDWSKYRFLNNAGQSIGTAVSY